MVDRQQLSEHLFEAALALKPMQRSAFLDEACKGDSELRHMVEDLLAEDVRAGSFLLHPPLGLPGKAVMNGASTADKAGLFEDGNALSGDTPAGRFSPGKVLIDRFVVIRFIAKGGMGEVYEAEDRFLQGAHIALKTILPHIADDPALQQRFEREVLLAREVIHPNLCPIYDIFRSEETQPGFLFLTMKLLAGETLAERLKRPGAISVEEGEAILRQMVAGLAAIHSVGIVHRDIKPNNIMLDGTGPDVRLFITDFGLARAFESEATLWSNGAVPGTPHYMAPELFRGQPPTQASDLFALGVVLHEVFTGQKPRIMPDGSFFAVCQELISLKLPLACVQLITHCLDHGPKRRCEAFEQAVDLFASNSVRGCSLNSTRAMYTRRHFGGAALAAVYVIDAGMWLECDQFENMLLPQGNLVALLSLPRTSDIKMTPVLTGVIGAIKNELSRLDGFDRDVLAITPDDASVDTEA
jgi:serine/threonine protein kinase